MGAVSLDISHDKQHNSLRNMFMKWQCRVRQMAMRHGDGRPDAAIMPIVYIEGDDKPIGHIITLMHKSKHYSVLSELNFMFEKTNDPSQIRENAIRYFSSSYYQKAIEFSEIFTATFHEKSMGAQKILKAKNLHLGFEAFSQKFDLIAKSSPLNEGDYLYQASLAHNRLFNPHMSPNFQVIAFEIDWHKSADLN